MPFINLNEIEKIQRHPGHKGQFIHTENLSIAYYYFDANARLQPHTHPHEQITNIIEGEFEFTLNGETRKLGPGSVVIVPPMTEHSAVAIIDTVVLDVFYPVREDLKI